MLEDGNIFVTGGAGTLGRAIARLRKAEGWRGKLTVYSTDEHKHAFMRLMFPDVSFICGDVRHTETLYNAMVGHDIVIHAAAVKVIPVSELWSVDTFDVNVLGSQAVCQAALRANVLHVLAISTDKACHPANTYGCTKMLMEKTLQEYARMGFPTQYHLVRYGNVLESTGSVIEAWKKDVAAGRMIKMTDPEMTRFWLSPAQAVGYLDEALKYDSGDILIPKLPSLSIERLARWTLGAPDDNTLYDWPIERIPMRPGEKMHETLLTIEEAEFAEEGNGYFVLKPSTSERHEPVPSAPYTSDNARRLTRPELAQLLANE